MMDVSPDELARLRIERDEYKRKCEMLRSALAQYANHDNWNVSYVTKYGRAQDFIGGDNLTGNGWDIAEEALK